MNYRDRQGNSFENTTNQDKTLEMMYSKAPFRFALKALSAPTVSKVAGRFMDSFWSTFLIDSFVKKNHIKMSDYEMRKYHSYNEFFTRKIKSKSRPINMEPSSLIAPCDGKVSAYPITLDAKFKIKNSLYTVESILKNKKLAKEYVGGTCVILRLTVDNYHRYCYVDDAAKERNHFIPGKLNTVNPIILDHVNIYKENSRAYCVLNTRNFGEVVQMEVGALMVGKIHNYHSVAMVKRGQEKGKFEFGGSTVVLLLKRDAVSIDEDILRNTVDGYETIVKMGEKIGSSIF
ncbi:phosphatidylserine decarboxylase [Lachnoclostridium phytofermentans]|uniref:Phosphatidylserine decarboxylase-related n=1 Tax=Lachnoclostridium phytofermentans (strain ATCC 700394 / DSM 18823 / ISDg) TaxID=357809 RepID=A9KHP4_LACP7|nr:phosphatidylserine decarboxylase [Lachnoclostridium phytofermentans]ABX42329.1 phosphatidylserine decarboxylase-related [Lachnoclostridium phytofermentans ISDg]